MVFGKPIATFVQELKRFPFQMTVDQHIPIPNKAGVGISVVKRDFF
jgi:hypothetical protein